jgi:uncharacterized damage-inducible protein DinB
LRNKSFTFDLPVLPMPAAAGFLRQARFRLRDDYLVKITAAIAELTDEQIWWRPNEECNSIGNLVLHLCGNVRQWIVAGVGGARDERDRPKEFARRDPIGRGDLIDLLGGTLAEVDARLAALEAAVAAGGGDSVLQRVCVPQGSEQTVLDAVFHVVEHFSYHTGQIVLLAKWHVGDRIRFYDDTALDLRR